LLSAPLVTEASPEQAGEIQSAREAKLAAPEAVAAREVGFALTPAGALDAPPVSRLPITVPVEDRTATKRGRTSAQRWRGQCVALRAGRVVEGRHDFVGMMSGG
jgi:hypothetical protein